MSCAIRMLVKHFIILINKLPPDKRRSRCAILTYNFLRILWLCLRRPMTASLRSEITTSLKQLVPYDENAPWRLLHASVEGMYYHARLATSRTSPSLRVVRLLLDCGFSPCVCKDEFAIDVCTRRLLAVNLSPQKQIKYKEIGKLLMEYGAHWNTRSSSGHFAYEALPCVNIMCHITLACLAARVVRKENIHHRYELPAILEQFVSLH